MAKRNQDSRAMVARAFAVRKLIETYQEDFDVLYGDARVQQGLPRDPKEEAKQRQIAKHIAALKKLGYEVPQA